MLCHAWGLLIKCFLRTFSGLFRAAVLFTLQHSAKSHLASFIVCIFDEDGNERNKEEAQAFMESYFYHNKNCDETSPTLEFKLGVMKLFEKD